MKKNILSLFLVIALLNLRNIKSNTELQEINICPKILSAYVMYQVFINFDQNKIENWLIQLENGENTSNIRNEDDFRTQFGVFIRFGLTILAGILSHKIFIASFEEPKILY